MSIDLQSDLTLKLENILQYSRSPYVRAHMNNSVAWQTWSPDVIELARMHKRLLFVSIGYAACHWCHVMERESFDNEEIADIINKHFIPVKVDREERPDIDRQYMNYVQATSGKGGWPLNVFLTPDLEPVFGGTYFPGPESPFAQQAPHLSFPTVLHRVSTVWDTQRERCILNAKSITEKLREFAQEGSLNKPREPRADPFDTPDCDLLEEAFDYFAKKFDYLHGGFGIAPKFPTPANLSFLLSLNHFPGHVKEILSDEDRVFAQNMVMKTLRGMARGGIRDHIGHGFARYSVTADWSLPHFEKMLFDQAQLLDVYLDAFLVTGDAEMLGTVFDISTYLTTPPIAASHGGFFSSEDADSFPHKGDFEKREGAFYVWTREELYRILGAEAGSICAKFWNIKTGGNISADFDPQREFDNQNVPSLAKSPGLIAEELGLTKEAVVRTLKESKTKLLRYRNEDRPRPDLDDKIVVSWNGLAISALARTSSMLANIDQNMAKECLSKAEDAARFIKENLYDTNSRSLRRLYRDGVSDTPAFAEDYTFLIKGLIDLYEATFDDGYLEFADTLQKIQIEAFWDVSNGGFFSTFHDQKDMILRLKDAMDNAEPSTNGIGAANLCRLGSLFGDEEYVRKAYAIVTDTFSTEITQHPFLFPSMMSTLVAARQGMRSIVLIGHGDGVDNAISRSRSRLKSNTTIARIGGDSQDDFLMNRNELLKTLDKSTMKIQICENGVCREELTVQDIDKAFSIGGVL